MKRLHYEDILLIAIFAFMTYFAVLVFNQLEISKTNNMNYDNFFSQNKIKFSLAKTAGVESETELFLSPVGLSNSYVIYNLLKDELNVSVEKDRVRVVYGEGENFPVPDMVSGRFFTDSEFLSEEPLAVVGRMVYDRAAIEIDGNLYYPYEDGQNYRIIGVMGLENAVSDLDVIVMLNWGGFYANSNNYNCKYIIDSFEEENAEAAYSTMIDNLEKMQKTENEFYIKRLQYVGTLRSFNYFTMYLYIIAAFVFTVNIIIISLHYVDKKAYSIAVKKLIGFGRFLILYETSGKFILVSSIGSVSAFVTLKILSYTNFRFSDIAYFTSLSIPIILQAYFAIIVFAVALSMFPVYKSFKVDTSTLLK